MDEPADKSHSQIKHNTALISLDHKLQAANALHAGNIRSAIYHQTLSLGAAKRHRFSETSRNCGDLGDVIRKITETNPSERTTDRSISAKEGFVDLCHKINNLPQEWTVLQIAKEFSPIATCLTHEELLKEPTRIWLTIFRCSDPKDDKRLEPILLDLDPPEEDTSLKYPNFFEHISSIPADVRKAVNFDAPAAAPGDTQDKQLEAVEHLISSAIERVRTWLGPWSNLFVGKSRSQADQKLEAEIYNQVETFCIQNLINHSTQRLVSLIARRLDLLEEIQLFELCCSEQFNLNDSQIEALYALLSDIKRVKFPSKADRLDCYPVLLVVDELLDSMPWEMIHPTSELCRFSSFQMLCELHQFYQHRIKNGYLSMEASNCCAIINPDKNLQKMSTRLQLFYKEWYPDFQLLIDQPPTETEFSNVLNQSDVVIYNGHGSGLQFMNGDTLMKRDINCVTFLFGCDSVRLYSNGLFTEMIGTHHYYNAAHSPTVMGALWVLTDLFTDIYSLLLVGNWIPSTNAKYANQDISLIDTVAFKAGKWQFNKSSSSRAGLKKHPNLLRLMGDCRLFLKLPHRIRCAMVCRGLPVINRLCN